MTRSFIGRRTLAAAFDDDDVFLIKIARPPLPPGNDANSVSYNFFGYFAEGPKYVVVPRVRSDISDRYKIEQLQCRGIVKGLPVTGGLGRPLLYTEIR